ncbi:MAG: NAD-dependent epimerase/dehydratase family protein [Acidobacteriota bacterium]|nr:NAD-dependent epimerase/dehydratase family protein [Blastocatellia bacterium]MDW8411614.1 NAD-dependent epimerase/dehydratase family protein [Acidobacteriota bacterium]
MKILVTGAAGFIGSHIVDAYVAAGHEVVAVDDLSTGLRENVNSRARFYELSICNSQLDELVADEKPEVINHHAAQIDVRKSVTSPCFDAEVNILGSLRLLEAAKVAGTQFVIFASTGGAIYGEQDYYPADEEHPLRPLSPYGVAKLAVEKYLTYYHLVHGIEYVALRYSNVYGPRQNPKGEAGVVAIFCEKILCGTQPIINGTGLQTRDYVYIDDVVRANLAVLSANKQAINRPFNIGTGVETNVVTVFKLLKELIGSDVEQVHGPAKPGEQMRSVLDCKQAAVLLGWQAEVTLQEGLRRTVEYYKERRTK